jgi:uncharacterized membrane protein (UPF0136 family)
MQTRKAGGERADLAGVARGVGARLERARGSGLVKTNAALQLRGRNMGIRLALFIVGGALLGFGYHRFVGCRTGACMITANPYVSTLYGALMGYLLSGGVR